MLQIHTQGKWIEALEWHTVDTSALGAQLLWHYAMVALKQAHTLQTSEIMPACVRQESSLRTYQGAGFTDNLYVCVCVCPQRAHTSSVLVNSLISQRTAHRHTSTEQLWYFHFDFFLFALVEGGSNEMSIRRRSVCIVYAISSMLHHILPSSLD